MNLQYIADASGKTTGVFIPITDWEKLKSKYTDLESVIDSIPEWQKEIVSERMKMSKENPERLLDWDTVKDNFILD